MISIIATIGGLILGGGGIWGLLLKLAARIGLGGIAGGIASVPILGSISMLTEKLVDFVLWLLKAALTYIGGFLVKGFDVISGDVRAAAVFGLVVFGAWNFGPGHWRFWDRSASHTQSASVQDEDDEDTPARSTRRRVAVTKPKTAVQNTLDTLRKSLGGITP